MSANLIQLLYSAISEEETLIKDWIENICTKTVLVRYEREQSLIFLISLIYILSFVVPYLLWAFSIALMFKNYRNLHQTILFANTIFCVLRYDDPVTALCMILYMCGKDNTERTDWYLEYIKTSFIGFYNRITRKNKD